MRMIDLSGERFGSYTVISQNSSGRHGTSWHVKCDCGSENVLASCDLRSGKATCCKKCQAEKRKTHGMTGSKLHVLWKGIKARCSNPNHRSFYKYGGRGIDFCDEWQDFSIFYDWAHSNGYATGLQIDRIDNDKGYSPSNCRFVTASQNCMNRRGHLKKQLPKGVFFDKGSYFIAIKAGGVLIRKSGFKSIEDALSFLGPLRNEMHGDFARP